MLISLVYRLTRKLFGALATVAQRGVSKDAEVLVLRHENAMLGRHVEKVRYQLSAISRRSGFGSRRSPA
jgi:putative transposase